eukprot:m.45732 g.45732  ORF g.45732 m.45732 type:complete len:1178 (-) comp6686_c0_seq1:160-3693(-)
MKTVGAAAIAALALVGTAQARSARWRKPMSEHRNAMVLNPGDEKYDQIMAAIPLPKPTVEVLDGSERYDASDAATSTYNNMTHSRSRRQANTCPAPSAAAMASQVASMEGSTTWHAFPDFPGTPNHPVLIAWAQDSQEEMLVTVAAPQNGLQGESVWLSIDGGQSFNAAPIPNNLPAGAQPNGCYYGNANPTTGYYNAYCTIAQPSTQFLSYSIILFSTDSGRTWSTKMTQSGTTNVPLDNILPHPAMPFHFIGEHIVDASTGAARIYYGMTDPTLQVINMQPLLSSTQLATWASWSTGGPTQNNTIFLITQETPAAAPYNQQAVRKATLSFATTPASVAPAQVIPGLGDIADFTQVGSMFVAEYSVPHGGTQGGFNDTALMLSSDGVNFAPASLPVGPTDLAEYFEVVDATEGQVTLAAQHSTARLQGDVALTANVNGLTYQLNASRALFSDVIPDALPPAGTPLPALIYDPTNPWGCNGTWNIASQVAAATNANANGFYLVVNRGNYPQGPICYFAAKLENAVNAGASGLIIVNNQPSSGRPNLYMVAPEGYDTSEFGSVPCLIVSRTEGTSLIGNLTVAQSNNMVSTGQVVETNQQAAKLWQYSQLYISDGTASFSRSLKNVLYVVNNNVEYVGLYAVASMGVDPLYATVRGSGTYLANTNTGGTLVSTNKGATWTPCRLTTGTSAPLVILDALSAQHRWSTPKSVVTAPGLIVANVADSPNRGSIVPYAHISRDGGLTWTPAQPATASNGTTTRPAPYYYDILDHGSVVVLVETSYQTSSVYYSLDEGDSWNEFPFYNATTFLGRWRENNLRGTFDCYPTYYVARPGMPSASGFTLFCNGLSWATGSAGQNFTIDVPSTSVSGFSGSQAGVAGGTAAQVTSVSAGLQSTLPVGTGVQFSNGNLVFANSNQTVMVRPGSDPAHPNAHHIRFAAIVTNFRATATQVFAYWFQRTSAGNAWIGMRMDFGSIIPTACTSSDYEDFAVTGVNGSCYMGSNATLSRRKQCSTCRQNDMVAQISTAADWKNWRQCPCASQDYACTFGYRRVNNVQGLATASMNEPCTLDTTTGVAASTVWYRRVAGDMCAGTIPNARAVGGGGGGGSGGNAGSIAIAIIVLIAVVGGGGFFVYKKMSGRQSGPRYLEIRADNMARAGDIQAGDDDDEQDDDDDLIDASIA